MLLGYSWAVQVRHLTLGVESQAGSIRVYGRSSYLQVKLAYVCSCHVITPEFMPDLRT
jgi:hypothetical protein